MRKRLLAVLVVLAVAVPLASIAAPAPASATTDYAYSGPYFGENNFPPGCVRSMSPDDPTNVCFHMRTGLNALDSPQVDVLVLVPVSPTAERDMRIMRQSVEMWEAGIDHLAKQMDLPWLADGMDFHITVDYVDLTGENGGEFTTYPVVDPEIVVIATNPVGGIGIGIDPVASVASLLIEDENAVPCHNIANPFDFEYWDSLPGFDRHHDARAGTYTEDCGGAGGNVCFAINGAIDPAPESIDYFGLFDLVSHEFGHCLTLGHVGDGAEGTWGPLPSNDIMAYSQDPPGGTKCVSTLDVEGVAIRMSHYLDVNGDGAIDDGDHLEANDQIGEGANAFQVQHPADHHFASTTGKPTDCPQPDLGIAPGAPRTDWTPDDAPLAEPDLRVTAPADGATTAADGRFDVTGTVEHRSLVPVAPVPTSPTGTYDDPDDDASSPATEITSFDTTVTATTVEATVHVAELWPTTDVTSPVSYSAVIDGNQFDSFIYPGAGTAPRTWDAHDGAYMPAGTSTWDLDAKTVTFHIPRDHLAKAGVTSPYWVKASANFGGVGLTTPDDVAPDKGDGIGVAYARTTPISIPDVRISSTASTTVRFEHEGGNVFYAEDSRADAGLLLGDNAHEFGIYLPAVSDVELTLAWTDDTEGTDLDLRTIGAADSESQGATQANPERVVLEGVRGFLHIKAVPYLVTNPDGVPYTLTATVSPNNDPNADSDKDGVPEATDGCPIHPGVDKGCPVKDEFVVVYVDGERAGAANVETIAALDNFTVPVTVAEGTHQVRIAWEDDGGVVAERTLSVTRPATAPPADEPPADEPPAGDPPANDPPAGDPPADHPGPNPAAGDHPAPRARSGYWMVGANGQVFAFGDAREFGDAAVGRTPAVDLEATPSRDGYWIVDGAGHVFAFGDAAYLGGAGSLLRRETVTSMSATSTGLGYWLFTTKGRVLAFGDADHFGDMSDTVLNGPVLDSIPTPTGRGYYMVASDGGVFTFGDARFEGSMGGKHLNAPVQSLVPDADGAGYWLVASDGGIFSFDAPFHGSMGGTKLNRPITGMVGSTTGAGYLMVGEDGGIFTFGDVAFHGSLGADPPAFPIASVAGA